MATTKKRIYVTVPPELEAALNDLRDATGVSPASFIAEIMTDAVPMIRGITQAAIEAKKSPGNALQLMQRVMLQGLNEMTSQQMLLIDEQTALRKSTITEPKRKKASKVESPAPGGEIGTKQRKAKSKGSSD